MIYLIYDKTRTSPPNFEYENSDGISPFVVYNSDKRARTSHYSTLKHALEAGYVKKFNNITTVKAALKSVHDCNPTDGKKRYIYVNLTKDYPELLI